MYISNIEILNFKNYIHSIFKFSPEGSFITGLNGIGKTNLLEAISYLSYGKSILNNKDSDLINFNKISNQENSFFTIKSEFHISEKIDFLVRYNTKKQKVIKVNEKQIAKISDLYKYVQIVYSSPDDMFNIFSSPAKRRQFLDMAIAKVYPGYIDTLSKYKKTLFQRNNLLKTDYSEKEKKAWDVIFCKDAYDVTNYRKLFIENYKTHLVNSYYDLISNNEKLDIFIKYSYNIDSNFVDSMLKTLNEIKEKESKYQTSLIGPHIDDMIIKINNKIAVNYASQGQKRSIVIILKLALSNYITKSINVFPILIFDDTLAELDNERTLKLLSHLSQKHQIFIASPSTEKYSLLKLPILKLD